MIDQPSGERGRPREPQGSETWLSQKDAADRAMASGDAVVCRLAAVYGVLARTRALAHV